MLTVKLVCTTCEDTNKQLLGVDGFTPKETEFYSLTAAWEHIVTTDMNEQAHEIEIQVVNDDKN